MKALATVATVSTVLCFVLLMSLSAQETPPLPERPAAISSTVSLVAGTEPGERLTITGRVFDRDGKTPAAGVILYLYQTDATGVYNSTDGSWRRPRINGWLKTDEQGRYEIRTIKPGSYPRGKNAAHIHLVLANENQRARWLDDFLFEGDPHLSQQDLSRYANKGLFSSIMKTEKGPDGILRAVRDIRLDHR